MSKDISTDKYYFQDKFLEDFEISSVSSLYRLNIKSLNVFAGTSYGT